MVQGEPQRLGGGTSPANAGTSSCDGNACGPTSGALNGK